MNHLVQKIPKNIFFFHFKKSQITLRSNVFSLSFLLTWDNIPVQNCHRVLCILDMGLAYSALNGHFGHVHCTLITLSKVLYLCHFGSTSFVLPIRPKYGTFNRVIRVYLHIINECLSYKFHPYSILTGHTKVESVAY